MWKWIWRSKSVKKRRYSDCSLYLCLELHFNCKHKVWVYFDVYHWQDCAPMYILCTMYVHCTYAKSSKFWRKKLDSKYLFVSSKSSHIAWIWIWMTKRPGITSDYSIVKDSSADLGVNSRLSKIDPQLRLSAPKFQKNFFAYLSIFSYIWEKIMRCHFLYFECSS